MSEADEEEIYDDADGLDSIRRRHRCMTIARSSASEVQYPLVLAHDLGYLNEHRYFELTTGIVEAKRMPTGYIRTLRSELK